MAQFSLFNQHTHARTNYKTKLSLTEWISRNMYLYEIHKISSKYYVFYTQTQVLTLIAK